MQYLLTKNFYSCQIHLTARKTIFSFFKCSEIMAFLKKSHWRVIFLVLPGKMIFFRPKIWSYSLDRKWKMIFLIKIHGNMTFSSNVLKRWSLQKNRTVLWSFLYYLEIFYPRIWYFFFGRKMKDDLSQEIHGNMIFSAYMYKCYKYDITLLPKKSKTVFFRESTLKVDWHSRAMDKIFEKNYSFHVK